MAKRILIVDDSPSMRQMVRFTLEQIGHDVVEAVDGRDALDKLEDSTFDMMITDLNMPNLDGINLIREIRTGTNRQFMPIVLLTTESHDTRKQEARSAGATGWITKPFKPVQLTAVVKKVIG